LARANDELSQVGFVPVLLASSVLFICTLQHLSTTHHRLDLMIKRFLSGLNMFSQLSNISTHSSAYDVTLNQHMSKQNLESIVQADFST
jgi:hypothetical protein